MLHCDGGIVIWCFQPVCIWSLTYFKFGPWDPGDVWEACVMKDLQVSINMHDLRGVCELRSSRRCMLHKLPHPNAVGVPFRRSRASFQHAHCNHLQQRAQMLQQPSWGCIPRAMSNSACSMA
jgi:hypothetical protein